MMKGLVDYGSDSEEDFGNDITDDINLPVANGQAKNKSNGVDELPDGFFDDNALDTKSGSGVLDNLPSISDIKERPAQIEGELEDFLQVRKDWEKKLAEKAQKKQLKSKKKRIDAFGGLTLKSLNMEEKQQNSSDSTKKETTETVITFNEKPKCNLLSSLPKPKTAQTKSSTLMVPNTVSRPKLATTLKREATGVSSNIPTKRPLIQTPDSEESDEETTDFFGLSTTTELPAPQTFMETSVPDVPLFLNDVAPGPSRPSAPLYVQQDAVSSSTTGVLSDEAARKLIYERELKPWGYSEHEALDAVSNIVDVSVDRALGPNVRENLLKNLNNKAMAQVALGPLPKLSKDPADKLSKRKHQITYLATQAVAREEQLQEQWAHNKQQKKMTSQKYGF